MPGIKATLPSSTGNSFLGSSLDISAVISDDVLEEWTHGPL